jgi:hypothetical protein
VEVSEVIFCIMSRMKTVMFLGKQAGFKMEDRGTDFQKNVTWF